MLRTSFLWFLENHPLANPEQTRKSILLHSAHPVLIILPGNGSELGPIGDVPIPPARRGVARDGHRQWWLEECNGSLLTIRSLNKHWHACVIGCLICGAGPEEHSCAQANKHTLCVTPPSLFASSPASTIPCSCCYSNSTCITFFLLHIRCTMYMILQEAEMLTGFRATATATATTWTDGVSHVLAASHAASAPISTANMVDGSDHARARTGGHCIGRMYPHNRIYGHGGALRGKIDGKAHTAARGKYGHGHGRLAGWVRWETHSIIMKEIGKGIYHFNKPISSIPYSNTYLSHSDTSQPHPEDTSPSTQASISRKKGHSLRVRVTSLRDTSWSLMLMARQILCNQHTSSLTRYLSCLKNMTGFFQIFLKI